MGDTASYVPFEGHDSNSPDGFGVGLTEVEWSSMLVKVVAEGSQMTVWQFLWVSAMPNSYTVSSVVNVDSSSL